MEYKIGDDVSYGFNGDAYYAGKIVKISPARITTDRGHKFSLVRGRGVAWRMVNTSCWYMFAGNHEYRNPSF